MTQSVVTIFYGGCSIQGLVQIFFELTSFSSSVFCFFLTVELVSLEENISFISSFFCHVVKKKRNVQSPLFLDTYSGGSPTSRVKITRDECFRSGGGVIGDHSLSYRQLRGHLRVIPVLAGNLQTSKLFQFPLTVRHQDINLSTWAIDLDSLLKVGHYGHYNR